MSDSQNGGPGQPCCCLPPDIASMMMSSNARFHERASFAAAAAMDDNTMMRMQFSAQATQEIRKNSGESLASTLAQLSGVINGKTVGAAGA